MKGIFCLVILLCLQSALMTCSAQSPFDPFLQKNHLTAVPLLDQQKVVPGAVYTITNGGSYLGDPTPLAQSFSMQTTSPEIPKQTFSTQKDRSLVLKILFGVSGGTSNGQTFEIDETTLTCKSLNPGDGKDLDKLVYTDPDFKTTVQTAISGYGTAELISDVCWATKFKMSESSSKAILGSINGDLQSCPAAAVSPQNQPAAPSNDGTPNDQPTPAPKDKTANKPATTDTSSTVAELLTKSTVGELIKSLQTAAVSALSGASLQGKYCSREQNTVELNAKVPVAIAMKTWRVWSCGPGNRIACVNTPAKDPNGLEYDIDPHPTLY